MIQSILRRPPISPTRLHDGRPILEAIADHTWESRVVLNPATVLIEAGTKLEHLMDGWGLDGRDRDRLRSAGGAAVMLYRAQGEGERDKQHAPSYLGLAVFTPDLVLVWRRPEPAIRPEEPFHNLGVEDARCTEVDGTYYLYYTGYATVHAGDPTGERQVRICLATTKDFLEWDLRGPVAGDVNSVDNKNAALLPEKVGGKWMLLHRPMSGPGAMAIHLAESNDPGGPWTSRGMLMRSYVFEEFERSWIGAGGPPIHVGGSRFIMIYHLGHFARDGSREYDLGAALIDFATETPVLRRIEPLMRPDGPGERLGDAALGVDNVLFTCANYSWGGDIVIPYAGADSRIFGASISLEGLLAALRSEE